MFQKFKKLQEIQQIQTVRQLLRVMGKMNMVKNKPQFHNISTSLYLMSHKMCWEYRYPQKKKSATGFAIFLLFKKGTKLSGYPKQKIFAFKVCANIAVTLSVVSTTR